MAPTRECGELPPSLESADTMHPRELDKSVGTRRIAPVAKSGDSGRQLVSMLFRGDDEGRLCEHQIAS